MPALRPSAKDLEQVEEITQKETGPEYLILIFNFA